MDAIAILQYLAVCAFVGILAHANIQRQWLANVVGVAVSVLGIVLLASSHIGGRLDREVLMFATEILLFSAVAVAGAGAVWRRLIHRRSSGSHPVDT
jgi:hypothetical protein